MDGWRFIRIIIFIVIVALIVVIFDGVWGTWRQGLIVFVVDLGFVGLRGRFIIVWFRSWFSINIAIMMIVVMLVIFQIT